MTWQIDPDPERVAEIARRIDASGLPIKEIGRRAGMDRATVQRAREGKSSAPTYARLERCLDEVEDVTPPPAPVVEAPPVFTASVTYVTVDYTGATAEEVAAAVADFLKMARMSFSGGVTEG